MTQQVLASRIGRDRPWLSNVETGKVKSLQEEDLVGLAAVLRMSISSLRAAHDMSASARLAETPGYTIWQSLSHCRACSHAVERDLAFCTHCGVEQPLQVSCPSCAKPNNPSARFCGRCGSQLQL